jgi:hypothetical protein
MKAEWIGHRTDGSEASVLSGKNLPTGKQEL